MDCFSLSIEIDDYINFWGCQMVYYTLVFQMNWKTKGTRKPKKSRIKEGFMIMWYNNIHFSYVKGLVWLVCFSSSRHICILSQNLIFWPWKRGKTQIDVFCEVSVSLFLLIMGGIFTEDEARDTLKKVIEETLSKSGVKSSAVQAVCLGVSGVNHPKDQERVLNWLRCDIFLCQCELYH